MNRTLIALAAILMTPGLALASDTSSRYVYGDAAPASAKAQGGVVLNSFGMQSVTTDESRMIDSSTTASTRAGNGLVTSLRDQ